MRRADGAGVAVTAFVAHARHGAAPLNVWCAVGKMSFARIGSRRSRALERDDDNDRRARARRRSFSLSFSFFSCVRARAVILNAFRVRAPQLSLANCGERAPRLPPQTVESSRSRF